MYSVTFPNTDESEDDIIPNSNDGTYETEIVDESTAVVIPSKQQHMAN